MNNNKEKIIKEIKDKINKIEESVTAYESGKMQRQDSEVEIGYVNNEIWLSDYSESRGSAEAVKKLCDTNEINAYFLYYLRKLCFKHNWYACF